MLRRTAQQQLDVRPLQVSLPRSRHAYSQSCQPVAARYTGWTHSDGHTWVSSAFAYLRSQRNPLGYSLRTCIRQSSGGKLCCHSSLDEEVPEYGIPWAYWLSCMKRILFLSGMLLWSCSSGAAESQSDRVLYRCLGLSLLGDYWVVSQNDCIHKYVHT